MFIDARLLVNDPFIYKGLYLDRPPTLTRIGSVIRYARGTEKGGQIVRHLAEVPGMANQLGNLPLSPLMGMQNTLSSVLGLTQIAAGASVLNLGVSIAGFAYMGYKLNQVQKSLGVLQQSLERGFNQVNTRLDAMSEQLMYIQLLVEDNRQQQQRLARAISHLQQATLIKEVAALKAELDDRARFPNESPREAIKTASRVKLFLGSQAIQVTPALDAELMLHTDIAIQGWAVATATEANLLLEMGRNQEAKQLLAAEVPQFRNVAERWGDNLVKAERAELATAYRFSAPRFAGSISEERVNRIVEISKRDRALSPDQIRRKKDEVEVEFEMSYSHQYDSPWTHRQIAVAEYLDGLSELSARLDSLESFAALCESQNVKSSHDLLPDANAKPGLYVLSPGE